MISPTNDSFYEIPDAILKEAEEGCCSRWNFAGCLASMLFTGEEMAKSNYRRVNGKTCLDKQKTAAIRMACVGKVSTSPNVLNKTVREGVDEMCWINNKNKH